MYQSDEECFLFQIRTSVIVDVGAHKEERKGLRSMGFYLGFDRALLGPFKALSPINGCLRAYVLSLKQIEYRALPYCQLPKMFMVLIQLSKFLSFVFPMS